MELYRAITRVGLGTDVHRLESEGKPLVLAGVPVSGALKVVAHSDGDVVLHALTDALLGAVGGPDIGELFPDTAPENAGRASQQFVAEALRRVHALGYSVGNVDVVIQLQAPKLSEFKIAIRDSVAALLQISTDACSIKAKTGEKLDAVGEGRAVACQVLVGLVRQT